MKLEKVRFKIFVQGTDTSSEILVRLLFLLHSRRSGSQLKNIIATFSWSSLLHSRSYNFNVSCRAYRSHISCRSIHNGRLITLQMQYLATPIFSTTKVVVWLHSDLLTMLRIDTTFKNLSVLLLPSPSLQVISTLSSLRCASIIKAWSYRDIVIFDHGRVLGVKNDTSLLVPGLAALWWQSKTEMIILLVIFTVIIYQSRFSHFVLIKLKFTETWAFGHISYRYL